MPITIVFTEFPSDAVAAIDEASCEFFTEALYEDPDSRTMLCQYKLHCEGLESTWSDEEAALENDYLVRQFLYKNPDISLDDFDGFIPATAPTWIGGIWSYTDANALFAIRFDACSNIVRYTYTHPESGYDVAVSYPPDDHHHEKVQAFEKEKYDLAKNIMGRHPPPKIQTSEFGIQPNKIHCNEGLEPFERNSSVPVCIRPQTFEKLVERGFDIKRYPA